MGQLINVVIDGIETQVPRGTLVVDAAKQVGVDIPVFCYHPKMEPVGTSKDRPATAWCLSKALTTPSSETALSIV